MVGATTRDRRSQQACVRCRRKKSKCPAEKPACSACQRLNQTCEYLPREVTKPSARDSAATKGTRRLLPNKTEAQSSSSDRQANQKNSTSNKSPVTPISGPTLSPTEQLGLAKYDGIEPPFRVVSDLVAVYRECIHLQPTPLFRLEGLTERLMSSPPYLFHTFLSLTLSIKPHSYYGAKNSEMVESYSASAADTTRLLSARGVASLQVMQALCLQALRELAACQPSHAWMTIGIASRLLASRALRVDESLRTGDRDLIIRCRWSVFILEKIFSPQTCLPPKYLEGLEYPPSAPLPPPIGSSTTGDDSVPELYSSDEAVADLGINAYYIRMLSLWGELATWLQEIRHGATETPWTPDSHHAKLNSRYFEEESQIPHKHLLRNVSFTKRTPGEIFHQREYWVPWVLMQIMFHGIPAIINHPFVHMVAMRRGTRGPASNSFLQQTVDQALFHSEWVFRLLRVCEGHQLEIHDPFVGHIVAVLAIIPWLFQFAFDDKVAQKARLDLAWCQEYLAKASQTWPHLAQKLEVLRSLYHITDQSLQEREEGRNLITFQPTLVWALLDPEVCQMNIPRESHDGAARMPEAQVRVTTRFTHPLTTEVRAEEPGLVDHMQTDIPLFNPDELEQLYLDDLFLHFDIPTQFGDF